MERFDVHVGLEVCEIVIESATCQRLTGSAFVLNARFSPEIFTEGNKGNKGASPTLQILRSLGFLL
jgi:hypothetical protein